MVKAIDTAAFRAAMEEKKTLVVDFWAEWCGPCRMLAPVMEQLSDELAGKAEFDKIDVDDNPDLAREYSIMSIPCVMVFKGGALAGKNVGFVPKSAMKDFIEQIICSRRRREGAAPFLPCGLLSLAAVRQRELMCTDAPFSTLCMRSGALDAGA